MRFTGEDETCDEVRQKHQRRKFYTAHCSRVEINVQQRHLTAIVRYRDIYELQSGISAQPMIRFFIKSSFVGNPLMSGRFIRY